LKDKNSRVKKNFCEGIGNGHCAFNHFLAELVEELANTTELVETGLEPELPDSSCTLLSSMFSPVLLSTTSIGELN
jgi:hypothetical protein